MSHLGFFLILPAGRATARQPREYIGPTVTREGWDKDLGKKVVRTRVIRHWGRDAPVPLLSQPNSPFYWDKLSLNDNDENAMYLVIFVC
jgi:hypothetical protein